VPVPANADALVQRAKSLGLSAAIITKMFGARGTASDDAVVLTLAADEAPRRKAGARHSVADMQRLHHMHRDIISLGSSCEGLAADDEIDEGDEDPITLAISDDFSAELRQLERRRAGGLPLDDPSGHRRHVTGVQFEQADVLSVVRESLPDVLASAIAEIPDLVALELRKARGRVD
jgi:hypothetical protein